MSAAKDKPSAELSLILETDMAIVVPTCKALVNLARPFLRFNEISSFELAINEAISNAIEHGNLKITEEEKRKLCELGVLESEKELRAKQAREQGKTIKVDANFTNEKLNIKIVDNGDGFNWRDSATEIAPASIEDFLAPSGRGLKIIHSFFDEVHYNDSGNEQLLIKVVS